MARKKDTREEILASALTLFLKEGLSNVSVNNIIRAAGYTQAVVYYYFESKDQLIDEMMYRYYFSYMGDTLTSIEENNLDWTEVINTLFELGDVEVQYINKVIAPHKVTYKEMGKLLREYLDYKNKTQESFNRFSAAKYRLVYNAIEDGRARGEIREDLDSYLITNMILAIHEGQKMLSEFMDFVNYYSLDDMQKHYADMIVEYIRKR